MATYTMRGHPELDEITEYDKKKLAVVIKKYNKWYGENVTESERQHTGQARWAYAIYEIKDYINKNMVDALSTLEETRGVVGKGYSYFPVREIFRCIDDIRKDYLSTPPHVSLLEKNPEKLMAILDELEICTRHVIQNASIQRLHAKSWVHSDALGVNGGGESVSGGDDALVGPGGISSLLGQMKELNRISNN